MHAPSALWNRLGLAITPMVLAACGPAASEADSSTFRVVATTSHLADLARALADPEVEVIGLMGEGVDPHLFQPTRSDIERLHRADVVLAHGLHLEGRMLDALERVRSGGKAVHTIAEQIPSDQWLSSDGFDAHPDPHVWMDPMLWRHCAESVAEVLVALRPDHANEVRQRLATYLADVDAFHRYAQEVLQTVPESSRVLVSAHDAFGYFGRRYGFEVRGIQGLSTESEAGVLDVERLVDQLVSDALPAVFVESSVPERQVQALIEGARAQGHEVRIGGTLFSDAMGAGGTYEGTWLGMMDHNVTHIALALGGDAPARGRLGQLGDE